MWWQQIFRIYSLCAKKKHQSLENTLEERRGCTLLKVGEILVVFYKKMWKHTNKQLDWHMNVPEFTDIFYVGQADRIRG